MPGDVPDEVCLVVPAEVGGQPRPRDPVLDVDLLQQSADAQHPGQGPGAQSDHPGELPVEVTVRDAQGRGDVGDRSRGRVLEEVDGRGAALQPAVGLVQPRQQHLLGAVQQVIRVAPASQQVRPQRPGGRPGGEQVDHPAPQRRGVGAEHRPAADRRRHHAHAVRLSGRLVAQGPVVRADQESGLGEEGRVTLGRLADGRAEHDAGDGRPRRGDPLAGIGDLPPGVPDRLHVPSQPAPRRALGEREIHRASVGPDGDTQRPCAPASAAVSRGLSS